MLLSRASRTFVRASSRPSGLVRIVHRKASGGGHEHGHEQSHKGPSDSFYGFAKDFKLDGVFLGGILGYGFAKFTTWYFDERNPAAANVDYEAVRKAIAAKLEDPKWEDGSWGPVVVRLGWHAAGTYDHIKGTGGSDGGLIRLDPQASWGANKGLQHARAFLEPIKQQFPDISYADLYSLASVVAIEEMGGPKIRWSPGRRDDVDSKRSPPDGVLPDASQGADHLRKIFYRMGFNDRDIVALSGAHCLGRCHTDRSGYDGPWTKAPTMFSNDFFRELVENTWTLKKWSGPAQYTDPSGELMMLESDMALIKDPTFRVITLEYAKDEEKFFKDFAEAFAKLQQFGLKARS